MTNEKMMAMTAAILTTLLETDGSPESSIYCGIGMDMGLWTRLKMALVGSGLITCEGYWVELTDKGREMADKCNAVLAQR
jgi:predicted transcriptional regulator